GYARNIVFVGLPPDGLRLRLNAGDRVEYGDRAVEHTQTALDLDGEIHVSGRVDDVDSVLFAVPLPETGRRGRSDGDAALLFLRHPVHGRGPFVHLADFVRDARVVKDAFGSRRLTGVNVRHDPDVAEPAEWCLPCHKTSLYLSTPAGIPRRQTINPSPSTIHHPPSTIHYPLYALYVLVISLVTSDSARKPCWPRPCDARPRVS